MTESVQQFQTAILESFPVAIVTMDLQMNITSFNVKAQELTGYAADEAMGRTCSSILSSSRCSNACPMNRDLELQDKTGLEAEIINRYGEHIPVRIGSAALKDADGKLFGYLEIIEDISREKELEREKENFQFMVVHDMKSPLVALLGLASRLQEHHSELENEKLEKYLASIQEAGKQLEEQITDFLEYFRQAAGKLKLNIEETDVSVILDRLIERHGERAAEKDIHLKTKHTGKSSSIMADPKHLQRVFENLLDNAIKYSKPGSRVQVRTKESEREVIVQFRDEGIGIPKEDMPYIFDAFHQAKSKEGSVGHGLGLAVVRAIVREHGGRVAVKSAPEQGTVFTVRLPKNRGAPPRDGGKGQDSSNCT
jgi:PAS domain S-box-containing protein